MSPLYKVRVSISTLTDDQIKYVRYCVQLTMKNWRLNREDREDAEQEAIIRVIRSLSRYDSSKPIEPWINVISRRAAFDWVTDSKRQISASLPEEIIGDLPSRDQFYTADFSAQWQIYDKEFGLQDNEIKMINLILNDYTQGETAECLGVSQFWVEDHLRRVRWRMRLLLD